MSHKVWDARLGLVRVAALGAPAAGSGGSQWKTLGMVLGEVDSCTACHATNLRRFLTLQLFKLAARNLEVVKKPVCRVLLFTKFFSSAID